MKYRAFHINEAQGLMTRLIRMQPFETTMPMVTSANISVAAQKAIFNLMQTGKAFLQERINQFIDRMKNDQETPVEKCQQIFSLLKLQFNALLDQFDIFADVVNQRSEHNTGIWIAGLDKLAKDALRINGNFYDPPPLVCYLDRGHGAAIRRARTRLPGGSQNPVAVIRIPRERMVASGIGSSLVHEVGHQGSALLELIPSVKPMLEEMASTDPPHRREWKLLSRWISEIFSDLWSVGMLGIGATSGLISVVSLPEYFVFRVSDSGPHPFPWIRVKISLAFGKVLYPDDQWDKLERLWESMYPVSGIKSQIVQLISNLQAVIPRFVQMIVNHRPEKLNGLTIHEIFPVSKRQPEQLRLYFNECNGNMIRLSKLRPTLVFAMVGQARADNTITPFKENRLLTEMLKIWALLNTK